MSFIQNLKLPLEVVFMIDRSGSMGGQGIQQAKSAMHAILRQMEAEAGYTKGRFIFQFKLCINLTPTNVQIPSECKN